MKKIKYLGLIMIMVLALTGCGKSSKNVAEQYCNILVKGNYGDMLDIAYFPKSDLITKDKIKEAKQNYFEEMSKNNNNVTSCEVNQTNEDDKKIYYKVVKNGTDTENIEIDKKTNKVIIKDLYVNSIVKVGDGTTTFIDGVELKDPQKKPLAEEGKTRNDFDYNDEYENYLKSLKTYEYVYNITTLKHANYKIKYTHIFYKDVEKEICKEENCVNSWYRQGTDGVEVLDSTSIKDQDLVNTLKDMFKEIALVGFEGKDKNSINKYFENSEAKAYIDIFKKERQTQDDGFGSSHYTYKKLNESTNGSIWFIKVWYIEEDEIKIDVQVHYIADISAKYKGTEEGLASVISNVTLKKYNNSWKIVSFDDVRYG